MLLQKVSKVMEAINISSGLSKKEKYELVLKTTQSLIEDESNLIANLANVCAVIREAFDFLWVGFYLVDNDELVLGPFQGPLACTRIAMGKGVCGTAWQTATTQVVADVEQFPGHIACSSLSKSEIVVPVIKNNNVVAVLDIDSTELETFNEIDKNALENLAELLVNIF